MMNKNGVSRERNWGFNGGGRFVCMYYKEVLILVFF